MVCRKCGYQNDAQARFCGGCGHKLTQKKSVNPVVWGVLSACLVVVGIVIGIMIPREKTTALAETEPAVAAPAQTVPVVTAPAETLPVETAPAETTPAETLPVETAPAETTPAQIGHVLPLESDGVAVLYTNGTVRVSGNDRFSAAVSEWRGVETLTYCSFSAMAEGSLLLGLTEQGTVLTTEGEIPGWTDVDKLYVLYEGVVGVTDDGAVLVHGTWEDDTFLTGLSGVESLVYSSNQNIWGCLKKDGSVCFFDSYGYYQDSSWKNVAELRDSGHGFYAIMKDGTVDGQIDDTYEGLKGAVKVVVHYDWVFGISEDGRR